MNWQKNCVSNFLEKIGNRRFPMNSIFIEIYLKNK